MKGKRGIKIPTRLLVSALLFLAQIVFLFVIVYTLSKNFVAIYFAFNIIAALLVVYILNRRDNPSYKIMWIVFILIFPIFGISVFLLWGGERVMPHLRKQMGRCERHYLKYLPPDWEVREALKKYDLSHYKQADYLVSESGYPLYDGTSTEYLAPGEVFLTRLLEELQKAEKYIFIEFFILAEGEMWNAIHDILKEKLKRGVEVRIIFDDFGSIRRQSKDFLKNLRAEGIKISEFNPIRPSVNAFTNNRNHRKIVVIDGKTAVTGGINIGDEYINAERPLGYWMDSAIIIKGRAVRSFLAMFCAMWEFTTKRHIAIGKYIPDYSVDAEGFVLPYCDGPLSRHNPAEGIYKQILNSSQEYVYIATPYLIIDNSMTEVLKMAAKSGIDVRIITPGVPDKWYVHPATQYSYLELLEAGVKIYEYTPGFLHSKLFVSDDKIATVGTVNMDYRSFVLHFECGAWICNNDTVLDVKQNFLDILECSKEITLKEWQSIPVFRKLKQTVLHLFAPFM